jgi:uncharacterized protein (TIGR00297 family)
MVDYLPITVTLISLMIITVIAGKLTIAAALTGGLLSILIFAGTGYNGIALLATFFILGTAATSFGMNYKERYGLAEKNKGKRTAGQVIANAGVPAILGLVAWMHPTLSKLAHLMVAATFASAAADTLSSELGNIYGRKFYNILTLKEDTKGLDGVVSREGTLIGFLGSLIIATIYVFDKGWDADFIWIIVAGIIGNLSDSILGATLERKNLLSNNTVNFLNTSIAALVALLLHTIH